jgi:hypothetical protein
MITLLNLHNLFIQHKLFNMKFYTLVGISLMTFGTLSAQRSLTSSELKDISIASQFSNGDEILEFTLPDGSVIKKGSEFVFGKPINNSSSYTRVYFGYMSLGKALLVTPVAMPGSWVGTKLVVDKLKVQHKKLSKESELAVMLYVQDPTLSSALGGNNRTITDIEMALNTGEIVNPNAAMSREQAIAKLKESKDLLDLGLISQEEYETLKSKLTPIISAGK